MKKILFLSLFISFKMLGQVPKMEVITTASENIDGIRVILKNTVPNSYQSAIVGLNNSTNGNGNGVVGEHAGSGIGVFGRSSGGTGVYGFSQFGTGTYGVYGLAYGAGSKGVRGYSENGYGHGVYGSAESGIGVVGYAQNFSSTTGIGGHFSNASATGYALITGTGKVGIGTETPAAKMDIKGTINFSHFYYDTVEDTYIRGGKAGSKVIINDGAGLGTVGIGVVPNLNVDEKLDVNGRIRIRQTGATSGVWMNNSTNSLSSADGAFYGMKLDTETGIFIGNAWRFWVNNAGNGYLNGSLIQTSDRRLKKDFQPITNSLSSIYKLNGYHYKWIEASRSQDLQTGLIAQEVQKIFPELVQTDEKGFLSVNYIGLVPHLIEAAKELRNENITLKNRLDKIEAMLTAIHPNMESLNSKK